MKMCNLKSGDITKSGNFVLIKQIATLDEFYRALENNKSIYVHQWMKMHPTAFFYSWQIRMIKICLDRGLFWVAKKIQK